MHLEAVILQDCRCTWRRIGIEFRDTFPGCNQVSLEMHLEAWSEWTQRWPWRLFQGSLEIPFRGHDHAYLEAVMKEVWGCTWRPRSIRIGGGLWCHPSTGNRLGGRCEGSLDSVHWSTHNCGNIENWVQQGPLRAERWETGWERETVDLWMMQYIMYAILSVNW